MTTRAIPLSEVLEETDERLGQRPEPEVLTLTEKNGFLSQRERFNKRLAVEDTSDYKVVRRFDVAFNPYLLWAGAVAQNLDWDEGIISPLYPTFRLRTGYEPRYIDRLLRSPSMVARYDSIAFGSVPRKRRTSVGDFLTLQIAQPPPLPEQRRIAEILDKADALRAKRRAALAQFDTLTESIFLDMFGEPAMNPMRWAIAALRELGRVATGRTPPSAKEGMFDGGIPFVTPGDLESDQPVRRTVTEEGAAESSVVSAESTLVCCIGATIGKMGKAATRSAFNQQINAVEWGASVDPAYGLTAMRFFKPTIIAWGSSTTLPILKKSAFERIEIPVPPLDLQKGFARRLDSLEDLRNDSRRSLTALNELFRALQSKAFSEGL